MMPERESPCFLSGITSIFNKTLFEKDARASPALAIQDTGTGTVAGILLERGRGSKGEAEEDNEE